MPLRLLQNGTSVKQFPEWQLLQEYINIPIFSGQLSHSETRRTQVHGSQCCVSSSRYSSSTNMAGIPLSLNHGCMYLVYWVSKDFLALSYYEFPRYFHLLYDMDSESSNTGGKRRIWQPSYTRTIYLLRNMGEGLIAHGNCWGSPKLPVMWHENACWLVNLGIPLMASCAELFLAHDQARRTLGDPHQFKQRFHWIMTDINQEGRLDGQMYIVHVRIYH